MVSCFDKSPFYTKKVVSFEVEIYIPLCLEDNFNFSKAAKFNSGARLVRIDCQQNLKRCVRINTSLK